MKPDLTSHPKYMDFITVNTSFKGFPKIIRLHLSIKERRIILNILERMPIKKLDWGLIIICMIFFMVLC